MCGATQVSAYDLANTYFPAWETLIKQGKALGIMVPIACFVLDMRDTYFKISCCIVSKFIFAYVLIRDRYFQNPNFWSCSAPHPYTGVCSSKLTQWTCAAFIVVPRDSQWCCWLPWCIACELFLRENRHCTYSCLVVFLKMSLVSICVCSAVTMPSMGCLRVEIRLWTSKLLFHGHHLCVELS